MRKVLVSSLVLSLCLGFSAESGAARKKTARATKRATTASAVRARGGNSTTTTSSSSSSGTDITTSTHRFIADGMNYDTKLLYGVKYDLAQMLLPSVSSYYKTNGSEAVNEKLCFGPFMTLTGISSSGDVVSYTAEGGLECQPLLAGYTYSIELKEASNEELKTFALSRRLKVVRLATDNQTEVDINYMEFEYEPFVNVSNFIPKVVDALNQAKTACSAVNEDMEKLKSNLGWSTGLSAGGMVLSAGATGVGVYNVIKTNQTDSQLERYKQVESVKEEDKNEDTVKAYTDTECDGDKKDTLYCKMKSAETTFKEYDKTLADRDMIQQEIEKSRQYKLFDDFVKFDVNVRIEDGQFKQCKNTETDNVRCLQEASKFSGLEYSSQDAFDNSKKRVKDSLRDAFIAEQDRIIRDAKLNPNSYIKDEELKNYTGAKDSYEKAKQGYDTQVQKNQKVTQKETLKTGITNSVKTSRMLDWVQAGLNAGSLLTSGGSLVFSIQAVQNATSALSNLSECEAKISALNLIYNEYKAELENYGDE